MAGRSSGEGHVRRPEMGARGGRLWHAARLPKIHAEWPAAAPAQEAEIARGSARACGAARLRLRPRARPSSPAAGLQLTIDRDRCCRVREDERKKMMLTSEAHMSLIRERKYSEMYVFVYACSWSRVVFIRIL
jgi:hypothetical protein